MSQGTTILPTVGTISGLTMVGNMNSALDALLTNNSGSSAPGSPEAYQFWLDTSGTLKVLKQRNAANNAWVVVGFLDANNIFHFAAGSLPEGHLFNGQITTAVGSNNLTVSVKTWAGADPSASDPVFICLNNTIYAITSALSVTINAGANAFNAGSAELATKEIDYFAYIGLKTSGSVIFLLVSRLPYGRVYGDFSATNTNEKYGACSTTPASTDVLQVVCRFNAILGVSATYYWSIPGTSIIINHPIYETRELDWASQNTGLTSVSSSLYKYKLIGSQMFIAFVLAGVSNSTSFSGTLPFNSLRAIDVLELAQDNSNYGVGLVDIAAGAAAMNFRYGPTSYTTNASWTGSGQKSIYFYRALQI